MPLGQSLFLLQGVPVTPTTGWTQVSLWQSRPPLQRLPAQQVCETAPQAWLPVVPLEPAPAVVLPAPVPLVDWLVAPAVAAVCAPEVVPELPALVPEPVAPEIEPSGNAHAPALQV